MTTAQSGDSTTQPKLGEVLGDIAGDLSRLFRQEVALAKAEVRQEAKKAGGAAGMLAGAGMAALLTVVLLSFALVYALAEVMHIGWAALVVGVLWAIAAAALQAAGRRRMRDVEALPQTTETLKENAQWLQNPTR
ncbi:MAG TPA: phage holin family protein [Micromonosporaceae bacterium]|nr:phage holin family protein [Micromonosporaceae bacterium]